MTDDQLLDKFDRIESLPVSEELLGAYLEGTLDLHDMQTVADLIDTDPQLRELITDTIADPFASDSSDILAELAEVSPASADVSPELAEFSDSYEYPESPTDPGDVEVIGYTAPDDPIMTYPDDSTIDLGLDAGIPLADIESIPDDLSFELPDIPFF